MKKIMKFSTIVLAVLFAFNSSFAANNPIINFDNTKTLTISLNDWAKEDVTITLKDYAGEILHWEKLNKGTNIERKYNLKNLPLGYYEVQVEGTNKIVVHSIKLDLNQVISNPLMDKIIFKPAFSFSKNAIELNHLALGKKVQVSVYDEQGVFFTKAYAEQASINTRFDITQLPKGKYSISFSTDDQYITQTFTK